MIPSRLLKQSVLILKADQVQDRYGTTVLDWSDPEVIPAYGYLQPRSASETEVGRSQQTAVAVLYLEPDADLTGHDRVAIGDDTYQVVGPPQVVYRLATPHHLLADVQWVTG